MDEPALHREYQRAGCLDDGAQPHYHQSAKDLFRFDILEQSISSNME